MKKRLLALLLAALTALSLTACGAEEQPVTSQIFAMDTPSTAKTRRPR